LRASASIGGSIIYTTACLCNMQCVKAVCRTSLSTEFFRQKSYGKSCNLTTAKTMEIIAQYYVIYQK